MVSTHLNRLQIEAILEAEAERAAREAEIERLWSWDASL